MEIRASGQRVDAGQRFLLNFAAFKSRRGMRGRHLLKHVRRRHYPISQKQIASKHSSASSVRLINQWEAGVVRGRMVWRGGETASRCVGELYESGTGHLLSRARSPITISPGLPGERYTASAHAKKGRSTNCPTNEKNWTGRRERNWDRHKSRSGTIVFLGWCIYNASWYLQLPRTSH